MVQLHAFPLRQLLEDALHQDRVCQLFLFGDPASIETGWLGWSGVAQHRGQGQNVCGVVEEDLVEGDQDEEECGGGQLPGVAAVLKLTSVRW